MREIVLAETAGFCFGVRRAVELAERIANEGGRAVTLGPIIHNHHVVEHLRTLGVDTIDRPEQAEPGDCVIIRSHGVGRAVIAVLEAQGAEVIDATCPDVKKIHRIIEAAHLAGRQVVVVGKREHPEVIAACGWCETPVVAESARELETWILTDENRRNPMTVVFQTTYNREKMKSIREILKKWCTSAEIFDTICDATSKRQAEAAALAKRLDAMVVIGDQQSANSRNLAEICMAHSDRVIFLESAVELSPGQFDEIDTAGIIAGASTPLWIIKEVYQTMNDEIMKNTEEPEVTPVQPEPEAVEEAVAPIAPLEEPVAPAQEEESFEAMLERSIKTLHTGEKVVGIVAAITPTEVTVDLGTKQSGYIPIHELTDDPEEKIEDLIQIGGEVQCYVMRVNDVEGMVMLSKKRLDTVKYWDEIEAARANRVVVEGTVTEENKGGVVVRVKGIRVFVPASQTGIPKDQPLTELIGQKVKLRITEVNQSRRRVVGSIRMVSSEVRREAAQKTWESIEEGKRYEGTVKSLTPYGVFVDIGGVDGMVHVSELSWGRIKSPADVVKAGDPIEVYVISFDKEKGKISLGHKDPTKNPWKMFTDKHEKGSIAKVRVVKLMPFGAFAEIVPGVDGLIHISQIADRRIGKPEEFLSEGQEIDVRIIDVDYDKKNVSLSIRALVEETAPEPAAEADDEHDDYDGGDDAVVYDTDINKPELEETLAEEAPVQEAPAAVVEETVEAEEPEAAPEEVPAEPVDEAVQEAPAAVVEETVEAEEPEAE
ncbi:MAG: bifunctional 4-hydroxy-3-methylbut-2-enyl diphosphate reductase/30S ribosomal protein S1 [Oscillospiraceae bacterium]|nr:bifunctional 4-hydroxy-3-methylbut-2-enyl diphosphate reductase/30S ribosomal protein S1 [Oscillospiraceae bacterium]